MIMFFDFERWPVYGVAFLVGYLLGSIPFGVVLTRLSGLGDIRKIGSGNTGATNVLRTGNKTLAFMTFLLDALKATLAIYIAGKWGLDTAIIAGFAAFIGHLYPCWLKYKGGKGVATYIGVLLGFTMPGFLCFVLCWLAIAFTTRLSSLAALVAALVTPLTLLLLNDPLLAKLTFVLSVILILRHHQNIRRILSGTESRVSLKK
ncbi:MAG: glycerol-3-phosphate 1-O-acyltransferase PlsY [Pseudomonadota bacterium]